MKNIVLIGFMGSGKTAMGRFLASELGYDFYDTDNEIEEVTGLKISQIFRKYGEIRFRSEENLVIKRMMTKERSIIATGGGLVMNDDNVLCLKENGIFVFLNVDIDTIISRVKRRKNRPLLEKGDIAEIVPKLYGERIERYNSISDIIVDTSNITMEEASEIIISKIKEKYGEEFLNHNN